MAFRSVSPGTRADKAGHVAVVETTRPDELPFPPADRSVPRQPDQGTGGRFVGGNRAAAKPHLSLTRVTDPTNAGGETDATYGACVRAARGYRKASSKETALLAGGRVGVRVSAMIASAANALADARYLRVLALREPNIKDRAALLAQAGRCEANARTAELTAYELAVREAQARRDAPQDPETLRRLIEEGTKPRGER